MPKLYYCSNCGLRLYPYRKAVKSLGRIIDLIEPHECTEEPVEFDLAPLDLPTVEPDGEKNKFVKKLNDLSPPSSLNFDKGLRDRRPTEQVKSSAPESLIKHIKGMNPTTPAHDVSNEPK